MGYCTATPTEALVRTQLYGEHLKCFKQFTLQNVFSEAAHLTSLKCLLSSRELQLVSVCASGRQGVVGSQTERRAQAA